jgi:polysaccharide export outer membrane protein
MYRTWAVGGGGEYHMWGHWWARADYTYEGLPNVPGTTSKNHTLNPRGVALGATYHFGEAGTSLPGSVVFAHETYTARVNVPAPDTATGTQVGKIPESAASRFMLGPADVIHVNVWKNTELSQTVTVGPDGFISLPLLSDIHVAGMTANELAQTLRIKLDNYIVNPQVTVSVVDIRSRKVFVLGQVGKPGGYPLAGPIDVLQLIAQAGGLSTYANREGITILRAGKGGTEKIRVNYNNVVHGDGKQNVYLQPGDMVVVP